MLLYRWFKTNSFASFQRQLNMYGFQRIPNGLDKGCYYHTLFLKDRLDLVYSILRISSNKGRGSRKPKSAKVIPDFWNELTASLPSLPESETSVALPFNGDKLSQNGSMPSLKPPATRSTVTRLGFDNKIAPAMGGIMPTFTARSTRAENLDSLGSNSDLGYSGVASASKSNNINITSSLDVKGYYQQSFLFFFIWTG